MKTRNEEIHVSILSLAISGALMATVALPLSAYADDDADALKRPTNSVEVGSLYSSQNSARFGQYNGLNDGGFYGLGGFDIRGGDGFDDSKNSALRWKLNGSNLGTTSRSVDGAVSDQGKWKVNLGYDELQHNITDSYRTPLQGGGGNNLTLPANFGSVNGAGTSNPNTRTLTPTQLGDFHTEKEYVSRKNGSVSTSYTFSPEFSAQIDYNHLDQSGAKLIGTGSQGGITIPGSTARAEGVNILMNPTSYQTDNVNAALSWRGDKGHLTGGYYGSIFHDDYNSLSWQSALANNGASTCTGANCYINNTMSTAPSNSLHQANLTGGYNFTSATKLAGGFSYGYNTQNSSYAPTNIQQATLQPGGTLYSNMMQAGGLPALSLNGVVETKHGDLKLTNQSIKDLTLTAGLKYNERVNLTSSNTYKYVNIAGNPFTGVNTPYSNSKTQYEASAAYRLTKAQNVNLAYEHDSIKRWCDSVVGGAQCVSSPASEEDKIGLTYRLKALDNVNFNAGYTYANRRADVANFQANAGNYAVTSLITVAGAGDSGLNAGNYLGYAAYPYANRSQNLGKAGVNWQVTQKLDVGVNGRYAYDNYDAALGVQNGYSAGVNVDTTYSYAENSSVSAYWSWQNGQRNLRNGTTGNGTAAFTPSQAVSPINIWNNQLEDNSNTVGLLTRRGGLLNGKLEVIGDASYALDTTGYSTQVPYATATACGNTTQLTCGSLSPIKNEIISLKLTGNYKVHKNGKVALTYMYQKLNSNDYFYNGQQFGVTPNRVMPAGLQMQSYAVNVVALSYNYSF